MIQMRSILDVADNSGARKIAVINPIGGSIGRYARLGRRRHGVGEGSLAGRHGEEGPGRQGRDRARSRKEQRRKDGSYIRFDRNAAVLINDTNEPIGTRVFGPVARELRERQFMKIISLAPEVSSRQRRRIEALDMSQVKSTGTRQERAQERRSDRRSPARIAASAGACCRCCPSATASSSKA